MPALTRREAQQRALRRDVLDAALAQLDEGGSTAVNWRALARSVGVSPSTLYTYFDSLDALYTALILEIYEQMAGDVRRDVVTDAEPAVRLAEACRGYRRFAATYPARFTLVFTDVLPGYTAPPGGPTIGAQVNVMSPLLDAIAELRGVDSADFDTWSASDRFEAIGAWSQLHGFVSLEVNHHLVWIDDVDREFGTLIDDVTARLSRRAPAAATG
jgi:AcrR family transcriptional regulator